MKSNRIDLPAELRHETPLAWLISTDGDNRVWIPKSAAEFEDGVLTLPEPLALEKGQRCGEGAMTAVNNLTGKRFGRLHVLARAASNDRGSASWLCRCDCGNEQVFVGGNLVQGWTGSCDCIRNEKTARRKVTKTFNPSMAELASLFYYLNGKLYYTNTVGNKVGGSEAGTLNRQGYRTIMVGGRLRNRSHFVYYMHTEVWPKIIDHINGLRSDDDFANLREVDVATNNRNAAKRATNTSGITGVSFNKARGRWKAYISNERRIIWLGTFEKKLTLSKQESRLRSNTATIRTMAGTTHDNAAASDPCRGGRAAACLGMGADAG